jgi:hypothetical protein
LYEGGYYNVYNESGTDAKWYPDPKKADKGLTEHILT